MYFGKSVGYLWCSRSIFVGEVLKLFVGKAQLVFQNGLAVGQCLNLIGKRVERLCQGLRELDIGHGLGLHVEEPQLRT